MAKFQITIEVLNGKMFSATTNVTKLADFLNLKQYAKDLTEVAENLSAYALGLKMQAEDCSKQAGKLPDPPALLQGATNEEILALIRKANAKKS